MKVESCNNNRLSRSVIEESYVAAIDTLNSISFALEDIKSVGQNDLSDVSFDKTLFDFEPSYDENFGFQFKFSRLPNLKTSRGISRLAECFIIEIGEKILTIIPRGYQKMDDIDVIFVSKTVITNHTILTMIISQLNPFWMPLFRSFVSMMRPDIATTFIFHSMIWTSFRNSTS